MKKIVSLLPRGLRRQPRAIFRTGSRSGFPARRKCAGRH